MKAMTRPMKKEEEADDRKSVEARLLHDRNHGFPADAARVCDETAKGRHSLSDEGEKAHQFVPGLHGAVARAIEQGDEAGRADGVGRRGRAGLAHLAQEALDRGMRSVDWNGIVDAFERAQRPVDQVGARGVDVSSADIEDRVVRDFGVAELFFDLGDGPHGQVARDGKHLLSVGGRIHLKTCRIASHHSVLQ